MSAQPARLLILLSGGGRTMVNLARAVEAGALGARIASVVASRPCPGVDRAKELGLPASIEPGDLAANRLERLVGEARADYVVLAGYLRLLPIPPTLRGRITNIHPALLPSFAGKGMHGRAVHEAVLAAGCKVSGCTVHICDERYDAGPILVQKCCPVREDDTPESLAERVFQLECEAYPEALRLLIGGRVSIEGRRARIIQAL